MDDPNDRGDSRAPELEDLVKLCRALNREGVRYVLIGGFAVILHGFARTTKDIDLLVDASAANVLAIQRAMADLPDNAAALFDIGDVAKYQVVRVADEFVVDLMHSACGLDYAAATADGVERRRIQDVEIPVATKDVLIRTKATVRDSDRMDVGFLQLKIEAERKGSA